jgi:hypothetical protein
MATIEESLLGSREQARRAARPADVRGLVWLGVWLALLGLSAEWLARQPAAQAWLPAPGWGGKSLQFEVQLHLLEQFAQAGPVDCLFLGSSVVHLGIDPQVVSAAYQAAAGEAVRCFNFGVWGLDAASADILARLLVNEYNIPLLIYGTTARDYLPDPEAAKILDSPWVQNRQGAATPRTWLLAHSHALRYLAALYTRAHVDNQWVEQVMQVDVATQADGYYREDETAALTAPPDLNAPEEQLYVWMLSEYDISAESLAGLSHLVALNAPQRRVIVVEVPLHPSIFAFLPHGQADYDAFLEQAGGVIQTAGLPSLWATSVPQSIPDAGWSDRFHLNETGAAAYSRALGLWLADAAPAALLPSPVAAGQEHNP